MTNFFKKIFSFTLLALILASTSQLAPSAKAAISAPFKITTKPTAILITDKKFDMTISGLTPNRFYVILRGPYATAATYNDTDFESITGDPGSSPIAGAEWRIEEKRGVSGGNIHYFVPSRASVTIRNICEDFKSKPQNEITNQTACQDNLVAGPLNVMVLDITDYKKGGFLGIGSGGPRLPDQEEFGRDPVKYSHTVINFLTSLNRQGKIKVEITQWPPNVLADDAIIAVSLLGVTQGTDWTEEVWIPNESDSTASEDSSADGDYFQDALGIVDDPYNNSKDLAARDYVMKIKVKDSTDGYLVEDLAFTIKDRVNDRFVIAQVDAEVHTASESVLVPCDAEDCDTAIGKIKTKPTGFIEDVFTIALGIAGGVAFLLMVFGAFRLLTSQGNPDSLNAGRDLITSAVVGLLFITFSVLLLRIIGVDILHIPGFGPTP